VKNYQRQQTDEVVVYWRQIVGTLDQRGLLKERPREGGKVLPEADAILLPERCLFVLDMQRLGGIPRETWLDEALWKQWRAALGGRRVLVSDGGGLAIQVAREPGQQKRKRLPEVIPLTAEEIPEEPYRVTLGYDKRGLAEDSAVMLDLADKHRAILTGGASGSGKTNLMQSVVLQLAARHGPDEAQVAVVDTKAVDFSGAYERLPHLFEPIARDLGDAAELIEQVEQERVRRRVAMTKAEVSDWRDLPEPFPLLLLVVDEAADFRGDAAMETLVKIARKGRAMGVSILLGTQSPSSKVIDPQVRANLPTAIAFQARTYIESKVILGCKGAEDLTRPGQALTFIEGAWRKVQVLRVEPDAVGDFISEQVVVERPAEDQSVLSDVEQALVRYAVEELDGAFKVNRLYDVLGDRISKRQILKQAKTWERRGWLTEPQRNEHGHPVGRQVTDELREMARLQG
jgi:DNA segregation ATPase FtsK/SpoIIIE-like protein